MPTLQPKDPIVLYESSSENAQRYEQERLRIAIRLGRLPASIEHIGSTAIADIKTKPIVDILIGLRELPLVAAVAPLVAIGYEHVEDAGGADRLFFRKRPERTHHLHVVLYDSPEW